MICRRNVLAGCRFLEGKHGFSNSQSRKGRCRASVKHPRGQRSLISVERRTRVARGLLGKYVTAANSLAEEPIFFNSEFANCSMGVVRLAVAADADITLDWRVIVNGFFPDYLYERGVIGSSVSLEELSARGDMSERARASGLTDGYSRSIRLGVPDMDL